jgi:hypothetical protein
LRRSLALQRRLPKSPASAALAFRQLDRFIIAGGSHDGVHLAAVLFDDAAYAIVELPGIVADGVFAEGEGSRRRVKRAPMPPGYLASSMTGLERRRAIKLRRAPCGACAIIPEISRLLNVSKNSTGRVGVRIQ